MENPPKKVQLRDTRTNRTISVMPNAVNNFIRNNKIREGYVNPNGVLPCWYIDENEKAIAIKDQKPFKAQYSTSEYFKITNRIDSSHLEGYLGHKEHELSFFNSLIPNLTYFIDFMNRKKIYFSFDKISLYQVMEIVPHDPLKFIMKRIDTLKSFKINQAFMIMPFHNSALDQFYYTNIKDYLHDNLQITVYRADDFRDNDIIVQTIYNLIEESEFIIADTTFDNKNSFYELGYASAIGKEIITVQNKTTEQKLFFDRAHIRAIMYDPNDLDSFRFDLESTIKSIRDRQS